MPDTQNYVKNVDDVISDTINWEIECQQKAIEDFLSIITEMCTKIGVQFFVVGKLMEHAVSGSIFNPNAEIYEACMRREDYEALIKYLKGTKDERDFRFKDVYNSSGTIRTRIAYISRMQSFQDEHGSLDINCRIRLIPLDVLPDREEERNAFKIEIAERTKDYLKDSARLNSYRARENRNTLLKKIVNRGKAFFIRGGLRDKFSDRRKKYRKKIMQYDNSEAKGVLGQIEVQQGYEFNYEEVYPLRSFSVGKVNINVPNDYSNLAFKSIDEGEDSLYETKINILRTLDSFCREKDIRYFLGWKLAASVADNSDVREELATGRWDVCIPRSDYNKLVSLLSEPKAPLQLLTTMPGMPITSRMEPSITIAGTKEKAGLEKEASIVLVILDSLPDNYEEGNALCVAVRAAYDRLKEVVAYETGREYVKLLPGEDSIKDFEKLQKLCSSCNEETKRLFAIRKGRIFICERQAILPPQKWKIRDFSVFLAAEPQYWHEKKAAKYVEYISEKKTCLLKKLDQFCVEKDIQYFAIASLLVGAVFYHKEIPDEVDHRWDVGLIRDDYERFLKEIEADGEKYGIKLIEFYDQEEKIPIDRKRVVDADKPAEGVMICLIPFDKVPLDFYLSNGFDNILARRNEFFKQLILSRRFPFRRRKIPFKGRKLEECLKYIESADPLKEYQEIDSLAKSFNDTDRPYIYRGMCFAKTRKIAENELFPLQRVSFKGIEINCPRDYSAWQPVINEELERQVSYIQRADLILLKEFDEVCKKLGVGYFVCGGTMLGYMRHGGFIPWDDDVDVAMLREDYETFLAKAGDLLPEHFFLQTRETDKTIPYLFSKIRLNDTAYVTEYSMVREYHQGICLDIFPFDYLPNDKVERKEFLKEIKKLASIHHQVARNQLAPPDEKIVPQNEIEKTCLAYEESILAESWGTDLAKTQEDYLAVATRYNSRADEEGLTTVGSFVPSYTYIDLKDLLPYQRGMFEGLEVSVPKRPDIFLKMQYGDYMQLPPEHNRIAHRLVRWKTWEGSGGIETDDND